MPLKPKRPCSYPGCPALTGDRFCAEHKKLRARNYERYNRDRAFKKYYKHGWESIRAAQLNKQPLCEECEKAGLYRAAELVHHIKPLRGGGTHDAPNLMSLCSACHSRLHAKKGELWG
jgi:5-methylcytosine-specific restriction protein A